MIPKIIHQIWWPFDGKSEVPPDWVRFSESWKKAYPDFEHKIWGDAEARSFVSRNYPDFFPTFESYDAPVKRVDTLRVLLLHHFGGLYADMDVECTRPFEEERLFEITGSVIPSEPEIHALRWRAQGRDYPTLLSTAFMASPAGQPFWEEVIREFKRRATLKLPGQPVGDPMLDVMETTGPFVVTDVWRSALKGAVTVLPASTFYPFDAVAFSDGSAFDLEEWTRRAKSAYGIHHWASTWNRPGEYGRPAPRRYPTGMPLRFREAAGEVVLDGPLVSCVCLMPFGASGETEARAMFNRQSYQKRELIVEPLNGRRKGDALQAAIARTRGHYVALWEPGVLSSKDRLAAMMAVATGAQAGGVFLERIGIVDKSRRIVALSDRKAWSETLVARKEALPSRIRGDDWALDWLASDLASKHPTVLFDDPHLYWHTSMNERYIALASLSFLAEDYDRALSLVAKHAPEVL